MACPEDPSNSKTVGPLTPVSTNRLKRNFDENGSQFIRPVGRLQE